MLSWTALFLRLEVSSSAGWVAHSWELRSAGAATRHDERLQAQPTAGCGCCGGCLSAMPASHMRFPCKRCCRWLTFCILPAFKFSSTALIKRSLSSRYCTPRTAAHTDSGSGRAWGRPRRCQRTCWMVSVVTSWCWPPTDGASAAEAGRVGGCIEGSRGRAGLSGKRGGRPVRRQPSPARFSFQPEKSFLSGGLVLNKLVPEHNNVSKLRLCDSPKHILKAHACFLISLCLLFASVGQASARSIASLPWTLFTSLLTHRLVLLCIDASLFHLLRSARECPGST